MARKVTGESVEKKPARPRNTTASRRKPTRTATAAAETIGHASILPGTETQIRERAYFIYLERGGTPGDPVADWFQAVRELTRATATARD